MHTDEIVSLLKQKSNPVYLAGMKRFGIDDVNALGIPIPELRKPGKAIKKDHALAIELWKTGIHEARIPASLNLLPVSECGAWDNRNFVKQAVNWALR
jgi:3-methyladenine DNA glycosylase AlkD